MNIKGMRKDMTGYGGFQFEVGKEYKLDSKKESMKVCSDTVFHYCKDIASLDNFYKIHNKDNRFFEIEVLGEEIDDGSGLKFGSNHIKIVRELSDEELFDMIKDEKRCLIFKLSHKDKTVVTADGSIFHELAISSFINGDCCGIIYEEHAGDYRLEARVNDTSVGNFKKSLQHIISPYCKCVTALEILHKRAGLIKLIFDDVKYTIHKVK